MEPGAGERSARNRRPLEPVQPSDARPKRSLTRTSSRPEVPITAWRRVASLLLLAAAGPGCESGGTGVSGPAPPQGILAFTSDRDGNRNVYVGRIASPDAERLTRSPAPDANPEWSPTGKEVAFWSGRDGRSGIYRAELGGTGRLVADGAAAGARPSWSRSGTRIAFETEGGGVATVELDGTSRRRVTDDGREPDWSPSGDRLVLVRGGEIAVANADGSGLRSTGVRGREPRWSPAGSAIAFTADGALHLMSADGSDLRRLVPGRRPAWSPDGGWLIYDRGGDLYVVRRDGLAAQLALDARGDEEAAAWRP